MSNVGENIIIVCVDSEGFFLDLNIFELANLSELNCLAVVQLTKVPLRDGPKEQSF